MTSNNNVNGYYHIISFQQWILSLLLTKWVPEICILCVNNKFITKRQLVLQNDPSIYMSTCQPMFDLLMCALGHFCWCRGTEHSLQPSIVHSSWPVPSRRQSGALTGRKLRGSGLKPYKASPDSSDSWNKLSIHCGLVSSPPSCTRSRAVGRHSLPLILLQNPHL